MSEGAECEETDGRSGSRNGSLGAQRDDDDCYHDAIDVSLNAAAGGRRLIRMLDAGRGRGNKVRGRSGGDVYL